MFFSLIKKMYQGLLKILPTKAALYVMYFRGYKKVLNLRKPNYYGEKIQWLKLYGNLQELGPFVDKYRVRGYVKQTIGEEYLIKNYGVYDSFDEIDFDAIPEKFVLKCTNGTQSVIICTNKNEIDFEKIKKETQKWLKEDFYKVKKEFQYRNVKNRLIVEEYMEDGSGGLKDYKFYCFDGEPYWYAVFDGRFSDETIDTYTINGEFLPDLKNSRKDMKNSVGLHEKMKQLDECIDLVRKLAEPFTFVRVDLYCVNGKIYFGELTFTDGAGCEPLYPIEKYDVEFAKKIPLKKVLKYKIDF